MSDEGTITIVTTDGGSGRRDRGDSLRRVVESTVSIDHLQASLSRFLNALSSLLQARDTSSGDFELEELAFSAEIGADGEFKLLGAGVGVSASSAITLTWRRRPPPDA